MDVIPALAGIVGRWNHPARTAAARALGQLGDVRAVPALVKSLELYDGEVTPVVIDSLGALGSPEAVETLVKLVQGTHDRYAQLAARALGRIGHPGAVPALVEALMPARGGQLSKRAERRTSAADALGRIGDPSAVAPLIAVLVGDIWVSEAAAGSLAHLGPPAPFRTCWPVCGRPGDLRPAPVRRP